MADPLITTEIALAHLHEDAGVADDLIALYIDAAVQSALNYMDRKVYATDADMAAAVLAGTAGSDPMVVDSAVKAAILLILGKLYCYREDVVTGTGKTVQALPDGARYLLQPYRVGMGA
jgi:hypothetical protein